MTYQQKRVKEFMKFFGQDCPEEPTQLSEQVSILRAKLILEECLETIRAGLGVQIDIFSDGNYLEDLNAKMVSSGKSIQFRKFKDTDLVELLDGISDCMVVCEGTAVAAGVDSENIHRLVLDANDSKRWCESQLEQGMSIYPNATIEHYNGTFYRLKREDGKIMKSPSFEDPKEKIAAEIESQRKSHESRINSGDGKIVKSPSYSPADIAGEIEKQLK